MNYLAHSALSGQASLFTVGNFIADHVRGKDLSYFPDEVAQGIKFHRQTDQFFDNHPDIMALRTRFPDGYRRYSGIILDMWFDHLLAQSWEQFYSTPLTSFQTAINHLLQDNQNFVPASQRSFVDYFTRQRLFEKYKDTSNITKNIELMSGRLRNPQKLIDCYQYFTKQPIGVLDVFYDVYHDMMEYTKEHKDLQVSFKSAKNLIE